MKVLLRTVALVGLVMASAHSLRASAEHGYVFVVLRSGANSGQKSAEERKAIQAAHMANINRLADEGVLLVAGPFESPNPDPTRRGIFIFDVDSVERARELTNTDPAVQAGVFGMDLYPLATQADLRAVQAADRKVMADAKAAGRDPNQNFPMHTYTLAIVTGGERVGPALSSRGALLVGRIAPDQWLAILDAPDRARAEELLAPVRGDLGAVDLSPWWASASLLTLAKDGAAGPR